MTIRSILRPRTDADLATICTWAHSPEEAERWGGRSLAHPVTTDQLRAHDSQPGHSAWVLAEAPGDRGEDAAQDDPGQAGAGQAETGLAGASPVGAGRPLAQFELRTAEGISRIARVIVDPALRGQGLGRRLIEAAIGVAGGDGATRVELGVVPGNEAAIHLYLRCGFGWDGESRGYPRMALSLEP